LPQNLDLTVLAGSSILSRCNKSFGALTGTNAPRGKVLPDELKIAPLAWPEWHTSKQQLKLL
jgi:hypothetical protein